MESDGCLCTVRWRPGGCDGMGRVPAGPEEVSVAEPSGLHESMTSALSSDVVVPSSHNYNCTQRRSPPASWSLRSDR